MKNLSRRTFLHKLTATAGSTALVTAIPALGTTGTFKNSTETKKLNIALCGLGRYANYVAENLKDSQHCRLAGIITGTPSKAEDWKKRFDIPEGNIYNYQNFDAIKKNKDIDLVYVILPNAMHKEFTLRAAQAGKHVIVEKPMAVTE